MALSISFFIEFFIFGLSIFKFEILFTISSILPAAVLKEVDADFNALLSTLIVKDIITLHFYNFFYIILLS